MPDKLQPQGSDSGDRQPEEHPDLPRRKALKQGLGLLGGTLLLSGEAGAQLVSGTAPEADSTRVLGAPPTATGGRSPHEVLERLVPFPSPAGVSQTPLEKLHGILTPSDLHFERHHAGIPEIDPDTYELLVHGMVERPLKFTLAELKRLPAASRICFIECSGNGNRAAQLPEEIPTEITPGQLDGLFSVSEWTGVKLATILREVGVRPGASWFLAEGQDAAVMTRSIPLLPQVMEEAMLAYAQNGEALRPAQGYPVRLLLPGWEGNTHIKWLRRIKLADAPFMTREETAKYTDAMADGRIVMFTMQMAPKSLITSPSHPMVLPGPGWHEIRGLAWSGAGKIRAVEISVDGGQIWSEARLEGPVLDKCATCFRSVWDWDGREAILMSRATDEHGRQQQFYTEAEKDRGPGTFYHNSGIRAWKVDAEGRVSFGLRDLLA